jgi:uncharacterized protein (DUF4415 family)
MSNKRKILLPTIEEDTAINAGIVSDPDTAELSDEQFRELKRPRGRPFSEQHKVPLNIRLDSEVLDAFKAGGPGWQTRINSALKEWLTSHPELSNRPNI